MELSVATENRLQKIQDSGRELSHRIASGLLEESRKRNVGAHERDVSLMTGAGLLAWGLLGPRSSRPLSLLSGIALLYRGFTGHCHVYGMLGVDSTQKDAKGVPAQHGFRHEQTIAIQRSPEELYRYWRDVSNLPKVMEHLKRVTAKSDTRSEWVAKAPFDVDLQWEAEIFEDKKNELIAWRSIPGGDVDTAGSIHFEALPDGRGTALKLSLKYSPPGGKLTAGLAWLLGQGAEARIDEDLRRFKSVMEAGEAPTTNGQPTGPRD